MRSLVVLVHTVTPLVAEFQRLCAELVPGAGVKHVLDEPLLERVRLRGRLAPEDAGRLQAHVETAADIGAAAVLVTCSTISPCVDEIRDRVRLPVIKIDEPMLSRAVRLGRRIGVVATNPTTLEPTRQSLLNAGQACARDIEVELRLVQGALAALLDGRGEIHDRLVAEGVLDFAGHVDVVILAQASMARVMRVLPEIRVPVLSSPHLALEQLRQLL